MKWKLVAPLALFLALNWSARASAHGVKIDYNVSRAIEINANYDNGEPMSNAQVTVYAPDDPSTPWATGSADEKGRFIFTPDPSKSGTWTVRVRQAGHGDLINIPFAEDAAALDSPEVVSGSTGYTTPQIVLMGASVIWGFIGTALFFARGKN